MKRGNDDPLNRRKLWPLENASEEATSENKPITQEFDVPLIRTYSAVLQNSFPGVNTRPLDSFQQSDLPRPEEVSRLASAAEISETKSSTPTHNILLENEPRTSEKPPLPSRSRIPIRETRDLNTSPLGAFGGARRREPRFQITSREKRNSSSPQKGGDKQGKIHTVDERISSSINSPNTGAWSNRVRIATNESFTRYKSFTDSRITEPQNLPHTKSIYHTRCHPQDFTLQSWITEDSLNRKPKSKAPLKSYQVGRRNLSPHWEGSTEPTSSIESEEIIIVKRKHTENIVLDPRQMYKAEGKAALKKREDGSKEETICSEMARLNISEKAINKNKVKTKKNPMKIAGERDLDDFFKLTESLHSFRPANFPTESEWISPDVSDRIRRSNRETTDFSSSDDVETQETVSKRGKKIHTSHIEFFENLLARDDPPEFVPRNYISNISQATKDGSDQKDGQSHENASDSESAGACGGACFNPDNAGVEPSPFHVYSPDTKSILESFEIHLRENPELQLPLNIDVTIDNNPEVIHLRSNIDSDMRLRTGREYNQRIPALLIASRVQRTPPFYNPINLHRFAANAYYHKSEVSAFILPRSITRLLQQISTPNPHLLSDPNFKHEELACLPYYCPMDLAYHFLNILGYFFYKGFDIYVICKSVPLNSIPWQEIIPIGSQMRWWNHANTQEAGYVLSVEQIEDNNDDDEPDE